MESIMIKCKLTKVSNNKNALRTNSIIGVCRNQPIKGENFVIFSEPIAEYASARMVATSIVQNTAESDGTILFTTENSTYKFDRLEG